MWNFNNGQILKKMYKDNSSEISEIMYVEMVYLSIFVLYEGQSKCIICSGWDRKITIFRDEPDEFEAEPIKIIDTRGTTVNPGYILAHHF